MIKLTSRRAALVLAGGAVALAGGMLPAQAATTGWRSVAKVSVKGKETLLTGVDAVAKGDAWAVGGAVTSSGTKPVGVIEHWTGKSWRHVTLPATVAKKWNADSGTAFPVVGASSASNVWAFSENISSPTGSAAYLRLSGHKWTVGTLPGTSIASGHFVFITATRVISTKDVWVFGGKLKESTSSLSFTPYAAQYNGHKWTSKSVRGDGAVVGVSEISAGNMWAAIGTPELFAAEGGDTAASTPSVDQWNGKAWVAGPALPTSTSTGPLTIASLDSILATKGGHVWIGGGAANTKKGTTEFAAELTGSTWTATTLPATASATDYALTSMAPDGDGGIWAAAGGVATTKVRIWHLTGSTWTSSSPAFGSSERTLFQLAAVPGTSSVWGVGVVARGKSDDGLIALVGPTPR
jgi:hypothetical protein